MTAFSVAFREVRATVLARPLSALAPGLGALVGVAAAVGAFTVATTAKGQVSEIFDIARAREVVISPKEGVAELTLPRDLDRRVIGIVGVKAGGLIATYEPQSVAVSKHDLGNVESSIVAVSPGGIRATQPIVTPVDVSRPWPGDICPRCALIGSAVAARLRLAHMPPSVVIGGTEFLVIGELRDVTRRAELLDAVVISRRDAEALLPDRSRQVRIVAETVPGAARQVASQLANVAAPLSAGDLRVDPTPDPRQMRERVDSNMTKLAAGLAFLSLLTGVFGISASVSNAVWQRRSEFGLRRALGAGRRDIRLLVLLEAVIVGSFGGLFGSALGLFGALIVAALNGWSPTVNLFILGIAPLVGVVCGLAAGLVPANRASSVDPIEALRA